MAFLSTINIVGSGLTAQQLRLDIVGENVTNSTTTRTENDGGAYRRKVVVFESVAGKDGFADRAHILYGHFLLPVNDAVGLLFRPPTLIRQKRLLNATTVQILTDIYRNAHVITSR